MIVRVYNNVYGVIMCIGITCIYIYYVYIKTLSLSIYIYIYMYT